MKLFGGELLAPLGGGLLYAAGRRGGIIGEADDVVPGLHGRAMKSEVVKAKRG
jgi:hypothetical protein